jgi:cytochrome c oxidase subunit 4
MAMKSVRALVSVWIALLGLLALTIGVSLVATGPLSLTASLVIATAKAALIFWFFMHLNEENNLIRVVAVAGIIWLMILFSLVSADYLTRSAS